jgi:DNA-binding response OmpR family regulator
MVSGVPHKSDCIVILTSAPASVDELRRALEQIGYSIRVAKNFHEAAIGQTDGSVSLVVLDRPHCDVQRLSTRLAVFAKSLYVALWPGQQGCTEEQFLQDMDAGVDDVFSGQTLRQIVARIRALLRRHAAETYARQTLIVGDLQMDLDKHEVTIEGKLVSLTGKEFAILQCFLEAPGQAFSRQAILSRVWGEHYALDQHALDVHVHALRHKIEKDPDRPNLILTVRGVGYKLQND